MGSAHLVDISQTDRRAFNRILQDYSLREAEKRYGARGVHGFKPIFTDHGDAVVFGSIDGRVLVWNRQEGQIVYEMDHGNSELFCYRQGIVITDVISRCPSPGSRCAC